MTDNNHPITPPPELVKQWATVNGTVYKDLSVFCQNIANEAARWGADQELNACCEWIYKLMDRGLEWSMDLRDARRPKPLSLKEQALQELDLLTADATTHGLGFDASAIRRALESLPY